MNRDELQELHQLFARSLDRRTRATLLDPRYVEALELAIEAIAGCVVPSVPSLPPEQILDLIAVVLDDLETRRKQLGVPAYGE